MERDRSEDCLSDLALDRLRLGEFVGASRREAEEHLRSCAACGARAVELRALDRELAAEPLPTYVAVATRPRRVWAASVATLAAAAAVVLLVRPTSDLDPRSAPLDDGAEPEPGVRSKGRPHFDVFVREPEGLVREAAGGDVVHPGDQLGFRVSTTEPWHVAVLSVDAAGTISVYHPAEGPGVDRAEAVEPGPRRTLDSAIELDDVAGTERIYGVFCSEAESLATLRESLAQQPAAPSFPTSCVHQEVILEKRR